MFQEILGAHKSTYSKEDVVPLSPLNMNSIKLVGLSENCREKKEKESKSEPNFSEADNKVVGNFDQITGLCD